MQPLSTHFKAANYRLHLGNCLADIHACGLSSCLHYDFLCLSMAHRDQTGHATGSLTSLYEPHNQQNMASNYKGLYGIFYKISMEVVKSENSL